MKLFSGNKVYNFMGIRRYAYAFSVLMIGLSLYTWFQQGDSKYGLDFMGGHEILVRIEGGANSEVIRTALTQGGVEDPTVQSFEIGSSEYSIRLGSAEASPVVKGQVLDALSKAFPKGVQILRTDYVGPTVGRELRRQAFIAVVLALILMTIYIAYRFEMSFAIGAIAADLHDVVVTMGIYLACGYKVNASALAAVLTVVGYSVNDTIVIFDRIREEVLKQKGKKLEDVMNYSISITLNRTLITNGLTLMSSVGLYFFGGGAIEDLALFFMIGIFTGTFSTIYVASAVALAWSDFQTRWEARRLKGGAKAGV